VILVLGLTLKVSGQVIIVEVKNIADLFDPNDTEGRTYREINYAKRHSFEIGELVELESGIRLHVTLLTRDCDGTPLYHLGDIIEGDATTLKFGFPGRSLTLIKKK
jgi:hypothetical protein